MAFFWLLVWAICLIMAFRYVLRVALVADSKERKRVKRLLEKPRVDETIADMESRWRDEDR